jgi:hypothetical protein
MQKLTTAPIYVNPDDTRLKIQQTIVQANTERILLIIPAHTDISLNMVDLRLLQRQVIQRGKQFAIATRHPFITDAARALHIPRFRTAAAARHGEWPAAYPIPHIESGRLNNRATTRPTRYPPAARGTHWWRWLSLALVIIAFGFLALFFTARTRIIIQHGIAKQSLSLVTRPSSAVRNANLSGDIPLHERYLILETAVSDETTGTLSLPDEYASGKINVVNLSSQPIILPAGVTVQTNDPIPIQFITTESAELPLPVTGEATENITITIRAVEAGRSGNVSTNRIVAVPGEWGALISISNPQPTSGGTNKTVPAANERDQARLRQIAIGTMSTEAEQAFDEQALAGGFTILAATIAVDEILSEEWLPEEGEPADMLQLSIRVRFKASYLDPQDLAPIAEQLLNANLPDGFAPQPDTLAINPVDVPYTTEDGLRWQVEITRSMVPAISASQWRPFLGQNKQKALDWIIDAYPDADSIQITNAPAFWWWLPVFPQSIEVDIT